MKRDTYSTLKQFQKNEDPKRPTNGVIQAVRGTLADVLVRSMNTILKGVKVIGGAPEIGLAVSIVWERGIPVASIVGGMASQNEIVALSRGPAGPAGATGPQGPQGVSVSNLDGGAPDSNYGGITAIDCGGVV